MENNLEFNGIYRGTVVYNIDPEVRGKCKVFVHGVYPDEFFHDWKLLPWAEPASPIMAGAWTNVRPGLNTETGWCSAPHFHRKRSKEGCTGICIFRNGRSK
jgi:hypothetical protein